MGSKRSEKYGINVRKWCHEHEAEAEKMLSGNAGAAELEEFAKIHDRKLTWLMHERLIHLIVTAVITVVVIFAMALIIFAPETITLSGLLFLIAFILLIFYVRHYFFLENTVQKWYYISSDISNSSMTTSSSVSSSDVATGTNSDI